MNILIISPAYAPYTGVGANRMISLSVYLRNRGKNITVIRNMPNKISGSLYSAKVPDGIDYYDVITDNDSDFSYMEKAYSEMIKTLTANNRFDFAIISVGPFYTLCCANEIKKTFHIPVVIDFRDLFVHEIRRNDGFNKEIHRYFFHKRYSKTEKSAVDAADELVMVVPDDVARMQYYYPDKSKHCHLIMNGYDTKRISQAPSGINSFARDDKNLYLGVFGKFGSYSKKLLFKLLCGIKLAENCGRRIILCHIGQMEEGVSDLFTKAGLSVDQYMYFGNLDYSDGIDIIRNMDACVLVYASKTGYGTKVFDYIYTNKPIILMTLRGTSLGDFVGGFQNGYVCNTKREVRFAVCNILNNHKESLDSPEKIYQFSRDVQNEKYLQILETLSRKERT